MKSPSLKSQEKKKKVSTRSQWHQIQAGEREEGEDTGGGEEKEIQYEIAVAPDPGEREEGEDPGGAEKEIQQEIEVAATAAVQVKVKLKGKVPEAGIAEVKVSGSTGMNKSYSWARMTPLCFNTERVLFRGPLGGNAVSGAAA